MLEGPPQDWGGKPVSGHTGIERAMDARSLNKKIKRSMSMGLRAVPGRIRRAVGRAPRSPFGAASGLPIIHTAHHKVGTSWFGCVLSLVAERFGLPYLAISAQTDLARLKPGEPALLFQNHPIVSPSRLGDYRGSHMVRDPRDIVLSAYHYHLWTNEQWANTPVRDLPRLRGRWSLLPVEEIGDKTYKEYLNGLPREEGIIAEINRCSTTVIRDMVEWDYDDERIFELKYESIMADEQGVFRHLFGHYGFSEPAIEGALEAAQECSFEARSKRKVGEVTGSSHLRSGKTQQWREEYTDRLKEHFKALHGEDLVRLGYESDLNW